MKKKLIKFFAKVIGYKLMEPLFLMRMCSIEKHLKSAVKHYSFKLLDSGYDRIIWEYQFAHEKVEMDLICELLRLHETCKIKIEKNLASECGLPF